MGAPRSAELEPTGDLRAIEARIDDAKVCDGRSNLRDSLEQAADILGRYEKSARDVYVVCDRQALSWDAVDAHFAAEWNARMHGPGLNTRMFVLPVGSTEADNIAVESVKFLNPPAIIGQPADFEVVVRNYGSVQHAAVPIKLEGNNIVVPDRTVSLPPRQSITVPFSATFAQTGSQVLTARIKSAGYTGDDQLAGRSRRDRPRIRTLIVSGDERQGQFRSESDFLEMGVAARGDSAGKRFWNRSLQCHGHFD